MVWLALKLFFTASVARFLTARVSGGFFCFLSFALTKFGVSFGRAKRFKAFNAEKIFVSRNGTNRLESPRILPFVLLNNMYARARSFS